MTHYLKIYDAHGRVMNFQFESLNSHLRFEDKTEGIYNGVGGDEYWKNNGHKLCLLEPNSLHLKGTDAEGNTLVKKIPVESIHDIDADEAGVKWVVIKEEDKIDQGKFYYHVYDGLNFSVWQKSNDSNGFEMVSLDDSSLFSGINQHGAERCPADFIFNENQSTDNFIIKKSILSDSIKDFYSYVILKTFYENYKYFGAFGKEIVPKQRCDYKDKESGARCYNGTLRSNDPSSGFEPQSCPACSSQKNSQVMGAVYEIPIEMQGNETFISNFDKMFKRIDADAGILQFQAEDIEALKSDIESDCIGKGFGLSVRKQAINQDQVRSNFDDQESNLIFFSERVETTWSNDLDTVRQIMSMTGSVSITLGRKYFLKSTVELYGELDQIQKSTSNVAVINNKLDEIVLTENKHNQRFLERKKLFSVLQPYSAFPYEYVKEIRETAPPLSIAMYDRFQEVLSEFEFLNGPIETFGIEIEDKRVRIDSIRKEFKNILNKIIEQDGGIQTRDTESTTSREAG